MKDRNTNQKINYNLELLRLILSFWIVMNHCYRYTQFFNKGKFHVPTFMIMSFYFYYNILKTKEIFKIKNRFRRILIPYIIWPIISLLINNILLKLFSFSLYYKKILLNDLIIQIIFGVKYHNIFYFQFNLIFLTILFTIISFLFNENFFFIFQLLLITAYTFQYNYWNLNIFEKYSKVVRCSLGICFELFPFAVMGITLHHLDITEKLKKFKSLSIFYTGIIIFLIIKFDIFVRIKGYFYPGILYNVGGTSSFILFSLFSFQNKKLIFLLKFITKYTGGIYYIHIILFKCLRPKIEFIKNKTFLGTIFIYIVCYIICYLGNKLLYKTEFKFLFN